PDRPSETLQGRVTVQANGNQRFVVPVTLSVAAGPAVRRQAAATVPAFPVNYGQPNLPSIPMQPAPLPVVPLPAAPIAVMPLQPTPFQPAPLPVVPLPAIPLH